MSQHPNNHMAESSELKNHTLISCVSEGKSPSDYETAWSPTSPLEFRLFPSLVSWDSGKVGLSIVDSLLVHHTDSSRILLPSPDSKNIIFGSFITTRDPFDNTTTHKFDKPNVDLIELKASFNSDIESDIEISEDYTCVTSHGPDPKTTHFYGDKVLESVERNEMKRRCCGIKKESIFVIPPLDLTTVTHVLPPNDFLSFCFFCSKKLLMGKDIYMYRGYRAFCSVECRLEVIHQDEKMEEEEEAKSGGSSSEEDLSKKKSNGVIFTVGSSQMHPPLP